MQLVKSTARSESFGELPFDQALARTTHLGIGAHHDDLEFMAYHGILECFQNSAKWFSGVTCTDGTGSARTGPYANLDNASMRALRFEEQSTAARIGQFSAMIQLDYSSAEIKTPQRGDFVADLRRVLVASCPDVVYTHNPADKHDTHVGVFAGVIEALRSLPESQRPRAVYGCEVWRDLDWMLDADKVIQNLTGRENLSSALNGVFDSQITGGKRYDLGVAGRRRANATFLDAYEVDQMDSAAFAMDLTPLAQDPHLDIADFALGFIDRFREDVESRVRKLLG